MFSYRAMHMEMDGNRDGTDRLSTSEVLSQFMVAPKKMDMEMHMLGAMFAPTDDLALSIMVPYVKNSMDHVTRMGAKFETVGEGLRDISIGGIFNLREWHISGDNPVQHRLLGNLALGLPTGDDDIHDDTLMPNDEQPRSRAARYRYVSCSQTFGFHCKSLIYTKQSFEELNPKRLNCPTLCKLVLAPIT